MTTDMWKEASWAERLAYRVERHPLTVLTGYVTVFFFSLTLMPVALMAVTLLGTLGAMLNPPALVQAAKKLTITGASSMTNHAAFAHADAPLFLFVGSGFCLQLPSDPASRRRPCPFPNLWLRVNLVGGLSPP